MKKTNTLILPLLSSLVLFLSTQTLAEVTTDEAMTQLVQRLQQLEQINQALFRENQSLRRQLNAAQKTPVNTAVQSNHTQQAPAQAVQVNNPSLQRPIRSNTNQQPQVRQTGLSEKEALAAVKKAAEKQQQNKQNRNTNNASSFFKYGGTNPAHANASSEANSLAAKQIYNEAYRSLTTGQTPQAISGFQRFINEHPQHPLKVDALYWLGESYFKAKQFQNSVNAFNRLMNEQPKNKYGAQSTLKLAYGYSELYDWANAENAFLRTMRDYPGSREAELANKLLIRLHNANSTR